MSLFPVPVPVLVAELLHKMFDIGSLIDDLVIRAMWTGGGGNRNPD